MLPKAVVGLKVHGPPPAVNVSAEALGRAGQLIIVTVVIHDQLALKQLVFMTVWLANNAAQ